eukprot:gene23670-9205_t
MAKALSTPMMILGGAILYGGTTYSTYWYAAAHKTPDEKKAGLLSSATATPGSCAFDSLADRYDTTVGSEEMAMGYGLMRWWMLRQAQGDVLEISAGTGRNLSHYSLSSIRSLTLTDLSQPMLQVAEDKYFDELKLGDSNPGTKITFCVSDAHCMAADEAAGRQPRVQSLVQARRLQELRTKITFCVSDAHCLAADEAAGRQPRVQSLVQARRLQELRTKITFCVSDAHCMAADEAAGRQPRVQSLVQARRLQELRTKITFCVSDAHCMAADEAAGRQPRVQSLVQARRLQELRAAAIARAEALETARASKTSSFRDTHPRSATPATPAAPGAPAASSEGSSGDNEDSNSNSNSSFSSFSKIFRFSPSPSVTAEEKAGTVRARDGTGTGAGQVLVEAEAGTIRGRDRIGTGTSQILVEAEAARARDRD